jgi:hypothetical protein
MMMSFSSQQELNLSHLGAGVYILKSEWRGLSYTEKIILK